MNRPKLKIIFIVFTILFVQPLFAKSPKPEFYSLIIYRIKDKVQEEKVDQYLKQAYLPALHRMGKNKVGVFKPVASDTIAFGKVIYVLTAFQSLDDFTKVTGDLTKDTKLLADGATYLNSKHDDLPYQRMETILMRAFANMPSMETPSLTGPRSERVYELRSYEGPTEKLYQSKVKMFNAGGEIDLFKRLQFNAVFYAEVLAGGRMPNLIYMTTFESRASRDEHWKAFGNDPQWKKLIAIDEYKNTVSKADVMLLSPTEYSDY